MIRARNNLPCNSCPSPGTKKLASAAMTFPVEPGDAAMGGELLQSQTRRHPAGSFAKKPPRRLQKLAPFGADASIIALVPVTVR
jgi:hypothetical protein